MDSWNWRARDSASECKGEREETQKKNKKKEWSGIKGEKEIFIEATCKKPTLLERFHKEEAVISFIYDFSIHFIQCHFHLVRLD